MFESPDAFFIYSETINSSPIDQNVKISELMDDCGIKGNVF